MDTGWLSLFPTLQAVDSPGWRKALAQSRVVEIPAETEVFHPGDRCKQFLLVISGSVRVQKLSSSGREIVLYRVESGQSCILTTACLIGGGPYQAEAITETPVTAVVIPAPAFETALDDSKALRAFVFDGYGERLTELLMLIDAISFGRLDSRLADWLLARPEDAIRTTHQQLARELGTAREVISRTLKEFERRGWLQLSRGSVTLTNREELKKLAAM
ncbi:Crp/Fnr family transcriptional regulator [Marinobacterium litorale]|jgi:CRP/FNR family transcriptional regulator|uniref:Crp/Fnr family transcriptional regulator n=1 Tax=Marinobacterium litorale TaxID=404770 RepID=UPI00040839EC|nr:Crp/Fnr family transcriptional regulator [Marinobacterium litorale]